MTAQELAAHLTGIEYPTRIPKLLVEAAKQSGLVIVYGSSDDLMEFEGAITEEVGAWGGTEVEISSAGILEDFDDIDANDKDALREYFKRESQGTQKIEAEWCKEGDYSWTYKTDIPHETFEITEDGEPYCRGIVFSLADVQPLKPV